MRRTRSQRLYGYFALFMAFLLGASVIFPLFQQNSQQVQNLDPTDIPTPTLPPALTDFSQISFDQAYFHPSGLFTVAEPTGWEPQTPTNNGVQAQINMRNNAILSVIEAYIEVPSAPLNTLGDLNTHFNEQMLESGWRSYSQWTETGRKLDDAKNQLVIDFELTQGQQTYLARHVAWTDGKWIYVIRIVTTPNMLDLLLFLVDQMPPTLKPNALFANAPTSWTTFYNPIDGEILRHPSNWSVVDGQGGFPVSIQGLNGESLRIEVATAGTVADEAAARAYVQQIRPGVTLNTVKPVERNGGSGFAVSFNSTTLEGVGESGLVVLLNGQDGKLHVASIRIPAAGVDLNNLPAEAPVLQSDAANVLGSFNLTTDLGLPTATPTATPVPTNTLAPTVEAVVTEEAAATEEAGATEEVSTTEEAVATEEVSATEDTSATEEATATP